MGTITTPAGGANYLLGRPFAASYGCPDPLSGVGAYAGPVLNVRL